MVVATKFNVKHQGKDIHHPPSTIYKLPLSDLPESTLCPSLSLSFNSIQFLLLLLWNLVSSCPTDQSDVPILSKDNLIYCIILSSRTKKSV